MPITLTKTEFIARVIEGVNANADSLYLAYQTQDSVDMLATPPLSTPDMGEFVDPLTDAQVKDAVDKLASDNSKEQLFAAALKYLIAAGVLAA